MSNTFHAMDYWQEPILSTFRPMRPQQMTKLFSQHANISKMKKTRLLHSYGYSSAILHYGRNDFGNFPPGKLKYGKCSTLAQIFIKLYQLFIQLFCVDSQFKEIE